MGQHGSLGISRRAAGKLQVAHVARPQIGLAILQYMGSLRLAAIQNLIVRGKVLVFPTQYDNLLQGV